MATGYTEPMTEYERLQLRKDQEMWREMETENRRLREALELIAMRNNVYQAETYKIATEALRPLRKAEK